MCYSFDIFKETCRWTSLTFEGSVLGRWEGDTAKISRITLRLSLTHLQPRQTYIQPPRQTDILTHTASVAFRLTLRPRPSLLLGTRSIRYCSERRLLKFLTRYWSELSVVRIIDRVPKKGALLTSLFGHSVDVWWKVQGWRSEGPGLESNQAEMK